MEMFFEIVKIILTTIAVCGILMAIFLGIQLHVEGYWDE